MSHSISTLGMVIGPAEEVSKTAGGSDGGSDGGGSGSGGGGDGGGGSGSGAKEGAGFVNPEKKWASSRTSVRKITKVEDV